MIQRSYGIECEALPRYLRKLMPKFEDPEMGVSGVERKSLAEKNLQLKDREKKYAGAFVLAPIVGFYRQFISTFDFASLYPSLIISHQLCFSSWVEHRYDRQGRIWFPYYDAGPPADGHKPSLDKYYLWNAQEDDKPDPKVVGDRDLILVARDPISNVTACFVQNRETILPNILKDMLAMRSAVKKELKAAKAAGDAFLADVLDARQAAIKVICNAAYGFTGAQAGYFGCIPIAITTCFLGRLKIMFTKRIVETTAAFLGQVIYGYVFFSSQLDRMILMICCCVGIRTVCLWRGRSWRRGQRRRVGRRRGCVTRSFVCRTRRASGCRTCCPSRWIWRSRSSSPGC
jgi:DNA polymerase elongation subunit (family B)